MRMFTWLTLVLALGLFAVGCGKPKEKTPPKPAADSADDGATDDGATDDGATDGAEDGTEPTDGTEPADPVDGSEPVDPVDPADPVDPPADDGDLQIDPPDLNLDGGEEPADPVEPPADE